MRYCAIAFSMRARSWKVMRRSLGPPTARAYSTMPPKSSPSLLASPMGSPVTACTSAVYGAPPSTHSPRA